MTSKIYRTAQGRSVDIGSILNQQENTRAVGNMGVNARGDKINSQNKVISARNQQVNKQYRKQVKNHNVADEPVYKSRAHAQEQQTLLDEVIPEEDTVVADQAEEIVEEVAPSIGIAAAIAKARQIKQEPLKTPRQLAQEREGVKRI